jgi:benzil reductase ((S)-benzoin forming)
VTEVNPAVRGHSQRTRWPSLNEQPREPASWPPAPERPVPRPGRRSVILTGGTHGLGAALFAALHARGDRILVLGQQFSAGQRAAAAEPARVVLRYADLSDPTTLPTGVELAVFLAGAGAGETDEAVLLHAAAQVEPVGPVGTLDNFDLDAAVHVNLLTPMWLTNLFLGAAPPTFQRLRIVYLAARSAREPDAGTATYRATRAAGEMFMRCVREGADPSCTVDIIDAGALDTDDPHVVAARIVA